MFEKLIKGYTEKQGPQLHRASPSIIKRLPVRLTYDNNYFNDRWQGIPMGGYTAMVERMLGDVRSCCPSNTASSAKENPGIADRTIYCGPIDEYVLRLRWARWSTAACASSPRPSSARTGRANAVVNYTEREVPWTRIIELISTSSRSPRRSA